jgi:hypothetical protein
MFKKKAPQFCGAFFSTTLKLSRDYVSGARTFFAFAYFELDLLAFVE